MRSYATTGFQARALALACGEVERMLAWRLSDEPVKASDEGSRWADPALRARTRCTVWLACTSNIVSAGTRETIRYLVQHRMISALVTSAVRGERAHGSEAVARAGGPAGCRRPRAYDRAHPLFSPRHAFIVFAGRH